MGHLLNLRCHAGQIRCRGGELENPLIPLREHEIGIHEDRAFNASGQRMRKRAQVEDLEVAAAELRDRRLALELRVYWGSWHGQQSCLPSAHGAERQR
jgi:hypothetical protein